LVTVFSKIISGNHSFLKDSKASRKKTIKRYNLPGLKRFQRAKDLSISITRLNSVVSLDTSTLALEMQVMDIFRTDNKPILIRMDPDFSPNGTKAPIANSTAAKQTDVNSDVAQTAIDLPGSASQGGSGQVQGRGIDIRA
jgi:hypothetical protein